MSKSGPFLSENNWRFRALMVAPFAALATLALFVVLSRLTSPGQTPLNKVVTPSELNFLLVRKETDLELLDRRKRPEQEPLAEMESVRLDQPAMTEIFDIDVPTPGMAVPDLAIDVKVDMRPALAGLGAASLTTEMFAVDIPFQHNPRAIRSVQPRYPSRAQRKGVEGRLKVEFIVDAEGFVKEDSIKFLEAEPKGVFEKSVVRSLKRSRFEVLNLNGQAVAFRAQKTYHYEMPK